MSDYDMAHSDKSSPEIPDETTIDPNIERDDTDGGMGAGATAGATGAVAEKPGEEPVDLDDDGLDDLEAMGDDPGDEGNPLLQQNL